MAALVGLSWEGEFRLPPTDFQLPVPRDSPPVGSVPSSASRVATGRPFDTTVSGGASCLSPSSGSSGSPQSLIRRVRSACPGQVRSWAQLGSGHALPRLGGVAASNQ